MKNLWCWLFGSLSFLFGGLALSSQLSSLYWPWAHLEARSLVVRATEDGPFLRMRVEDNAAALEFVDPREPEKPPLQLRYDGPLDQTSRPDGHLAMTVSGSRVELLAQSGSAQVQHLVDAGTKEAHVVLSDGKGRTTLSSSPQAQGLEAIDAEAVPGNLSLLLHHDRSQLHIARGGSYLDATVEHDRSVAIQLATGGSGGTAMSLVTNGDGSSFTMRDPGGKVPIELSSGEHGKIKLTPGPKGCIEVDGHKTGC